MSEHLATPETSAADRDPPTRRLAIATLQTEAEDLGQPWLSSACRRLCLLLDLSELLAETDPEIAGEVALFVEQSFQGLTTPEGPLEESAGQIVPESDARWGEYLALIEPDWHGTAPSGTPERASPDTPPDDDPPAFDVSNLMRLLTGEAAPASSRPAWSTHPAATEGRDLLGPPPSAQPPSPPARRPGPVRPAMEVPAPPSSVDIDPSLRDVFLAEGADLFERIESRVVAFVPGEGQSAELHELGRCLHTLKGAAGSVDLRELAAIIHGAEERLEAASGVVDDELIDLLHALLRYLEGVFLALRRGPSAPAPPAEARADADPAPCPPTWRDLAETAASRPGAARAHDAAPTPTQPLPAAQEPGGIEGPVRVAAERIDELMDIASELIGRRGLWAAQAESMKEMAATARGCRTRLIANIDRLQDFAAVPPGQGPSSAGLREVVGRLSEQADDLVVLLETVQAAAQPLADSSDALAHQTLRLWDALQSIRIVPVRGLFQRLMRVAHEAARVEGRQVEVVTIGEDTGLDRAVQDKAFEPLLHLVRNAVCHGIEPAEERLRQGKPAVGRVTLEASRSGNTLVLSVQDDGRGLDHDAIAAKARRLGLIGPGERPGDDRLGALIFKPGFSTREAANSVAGRGVGMDVVSQEVRRLHGTMALSSQRGRGLRLSVSLPARLALEQSIVLRVDGQAFSLPIELVERTRALDPSEIDATGASPVVRLEGRTAPLIVARDALGLPPAATTAGSRLMLVKAGDAPLGLLVDTIEGACELVVRPLGALLAGHPLFSGMSLSETGDLVLALNPAGLALWHRAGSARRVVEPERERSETAPRVLVVDDSISVRKVAARQLRGLGFDVEEASDGLEALGRLRNHAYALVISDLEMPRMDGFELLAEMSRLAISPAVPAFLTSTRSDPATRKRAAGLGACGFLAKPIDPDELAEHVRPWLHGPARSGSAGQDPPACGAID